MNGQNSRTALVVAMLVAIPVANAYANQWSQKRLVNQLLDEEKAPQAVAEVIKQGPGVLPHLKKLVLSDAPLVSQGWAIIAMGRILGAQEQRSNEKAVRTRAIRSLERWSTSSELPELVRTWSLAARIEAAGSLPELQKLLSETQRIPALRKPWDKRAQEVLKTTGALDSRNLEEVLMVQVSNPQLAGAVSPTMLKQPLNKLADVMFTSKNNQVRFVAASYIGSVAIQRGVDDIAPQLADMYRYSTKRGRKGVFWNGGGLFVPGIQWPRESARKLMFNLIQWLQYTEGQGLRGESQQLMNNLRSVSLHRQAGVRLRGYQPQDYFRLLEEL